MASIKSIIIILLISTGFPQEIQYRDIPLSGLIINPKQEISGLDWYKDQLVLLPENLGGFLFMIPKDKLSHALENDNPAPIEPNQPLFFTPDYSKSIPGFEGLEAIAFRGNDVYITLESKDNKTMRGHLAWGTINPSTFEVTIPEENILELETPIQVKNMTFESLLIQDESIILFYEVQGMNLQKSVWQYRISLTDFSVSKIEFPHLEYRITDVSRLNKENKFWGINYLWSGDRKKLKPAPDPLAITFGLGETHQLNDAVERLIEFVIVDGKIQYSGRAPIQLKLDDKVSRNWEGITRWEDTGFIIATDKYPKMILGFVSTK